MLVFHQGWGWAGGGYLGVDLFFVLSGFLIAGKLLEERRATGRIDLRAFWGGRFRRLLPALLGVTVGFAAYLTWWAEPATEYSVRNDALAALAYVANWRFILTDVGYFAGTATPSPVRHLWSLSVEEQFYLLFPLLLIVLSRRARSIRDLVPSIGGLILASTAWTAWLAHRGASATRMYEGTDTRLATILLGVLGALLVRQRRFRRPSLLRPAAVAGAVVGVALVAVARGDAGWMYPWGQLAFGVAATAVVVAAAVLQRDAPIRLLGARPLVAIGAVSYSLYLWHWPVYLVLTPDRTHLSGVAVFALRVAVSAVLAVASYVLVEQPIRRRRVRLPRPGLLAIVAVVVAAGLVTWASAGASHGDGLGSRGPVKTIEVPAIPTSFRDLGLAPGVTLPAGATAGRPLRLALVGDSVAFSLGYFSPRIPGVDRTEGTIIGCGVMAPASPYEHEPAKPDCANWKQTWTKALSETPGPDVVLMVTGAWEIQTHWLDGKELVPGTDEAAAYVDGQLDQAVEVIRAKTPARIGALQLACAPVIDRGVGQPPVASSHLDLVHWFNERLDALAERHPGDVVILSINDRVCPDDHPVDKLGGVRLRSDGVHWTEEGALQAWTWLLPEVFDLAYRPSS